MVQNAEDAGATCMKILYDNRAIDPGGIPRIQKYFRVCMQNIVDTTDTYFFLPPLESFLRIDANTGTLMKISWKYSFQTH